MKLFILILLFLTSCGTSDGGSSSSSSSTVATTAPTPNASGELLATVDSATGGNISASALQLTTNDPLSQFASVAIPAGALSKNIDVKIFETGSLAIQIAPSDFGVTEIKKAGPALVIQGDSTALKSEITVSIPYDSTASLNLADEQFAVLVLSGNTLDLFVGNQLIIGSKTIGVKVNHFGAFQVVKYLGVVTQQKATVQISDSNLKTVIAEAAVVATPTPTPTPTVTPTPEAVATATTPVVAAPVITLEGKWVTTCFPRAVGYGYGIDIWVITSTSMRATEQYYSDAACSQLTATSIHTATYSTGIALGSGVTPINIVFYGGWTLFDIYQISDDNTKVCFGEGGPTDGGPTADRFDDTEINRRSTLDSVCYNRAPVVTASAPISTPSTPTLLTLADIQGTYYTPVPGSNVGMTLVISGNTAQMTSSSTTTYQFTLGTTLSENGTTPFYVDSTARSIKKVNGAILLPDIYPNYIFEAIVQ
jgi:hypothetical protein